jgi:Ca2+-binding EF-hand superfamily protein|mmetsp:Transcript_79833/g.133361  ORF Transcript_79833/g.133361 Transcript_79833/m.133361 type:complete len:171 (+) Transcript_79833:66-578(+)|eukprot:CAMPEP_0174379806 /NCGR_PEP_ID=MMETSP0811_2-20130205/122946_1 /TAXON_ID=73025 ORGANISM="Eutreptiella gymnastica-like, Strain CCMP1594" /NCGR_SAMPLE_ID=MMETSP0811_2 /ASSEMBLY_ACC=CAM_ASM_000667 /LENGTH=170 /DNA_ID=CAMNT_0015532445 /DNA_START=66 /DNA_END=578 /DNA_ORIENTATION=-
MAAAQLNVPAGVPSFAQNRKLPKLTNEQQQMIKEVFELFDIDGSGTFDLKELRVALRVIGIEVSKEDFKRLLSTFEDTSGIISMVGFTMVVSDLWGKMDKTSQIKKEFKVLDTDSSGFITSKSLQAICKDLNEPAQLTELDSIMNELVGDNQISEEDFVNLMLKSQLYNF